MKSETDLVTDDEWLLRRIWVDKFPSAETSDFSLASFEPRIKGRNPDEEGISLYREACQSRSEDILSGMTDEKKQQTGIVRIPVHILQPLGLTVRIAITPLIKGHVVIPELNAGAFRTNKLKLKPILKRLAEVASENVVLWPPSLSDKS